MPFQYIALEQLESVYKSCNLVANLCVHASPEAKQPMAIIIPHELNLRHALEGAKLNGVDATAPLADLCANKAVQQLILKETNGVGKKNGFKPMETLEAVILTADEWTPESGLVTAAQKVQRTKVARHFEREIKVRFFPVTHPSGVAPYLCAKLFDADSTSRTQEIYRNQ